MAKDNLVKSADALEAIMEEIEILKAKLIPLEEEEEKLRGNIVKNLLKSGLQYCKTTSGLGFGLVKGRVSYKVKEGKEQEAMLWAINEYPSVLNISAAKLGKVVQPMITPPAFIERTEGEPHLAVRTTEI